ncbi:hypothetical protein L228DRAFT_245208 [Xylona heveae TC161]|uniref:TOM core complex subunit Tom6 n=1 Tax=Xylona heveae (strain CBS 132557 / TC161) TaxID=1328760 RepID=A0A161TPV5_XYLHT|nr:hypothetical protein L228DRAFT_245208 [Xylona heveae TC161]KZF24296.1 hypothetical protein L228DRAFT_245208 [Xylona heveae TC161]
MAPKRVVVQARQEPVQPSFFKAAYEEVTSPENRSLVTAAGLFAAGVAFLHSSWSEILLPPV